MKAEVNVHIHHHSVDTEKLERQLSAILTIVARMEQTMAKSAEVQAMEDAVTGALTDITKDLEVLLSRATGLSEEDKAALTAVAEKAAAVAKIFDSGSEGTPV